MSRRRSVDSPSGTLAFATFVLLASALLGMARAQSREAPSGMLLEQEPACQSLTPTAAGGPAPTSPDTLVLRFLGVATFELAYRDVVVLLDGAIERLAWWAPNGVTPESMTRKVNAVLVGHSHGEHIWDAPAIAKQTGALVVADAIGMKFVRGSGLPEQQMATVKGLGGETFRFNGFSVEAVLGNHNEVPTDYMAKVKTAAQAVTRQPGLTADQLARNKELNSRVPLTADERDRLITEGTIGYLFTFDNGYRLFFADSAGPVTEPQRKIAERVSSIDIGLFPYYGLDMAIPLTMAYVRLFKPSVVIPTHNDGHRDRMLDMPNGPLALAVRDEFPKTRTISPLYRTPVCIDTTTKDVYLGQ